jgi:hypothetical protein
LQDSGCHRGQQPYQDHQHCAPSFSRDPNQTPALLLVILILIPIEPPFVLSDDPVTS